MKNNSMVHTTRRWVGIVLLVGILLISAFTWTKLIYSQCVSPPAKGYYRFEYGGLINIVEKKQPMDFEAVHGWRRGPMDFFSLYPFALIFGSSLSPLLIFSLELLIVLAFLLIVLKLYHRDGQPWWYSLVFIAVVLSSAPLKYRVTMIDYNSLLGFCLFPMAAFLMLKKDRPALAGILIAFASHFRILSVALVPFFFLQNRKTIFPFLICTSLILLAGTVYLGPYHGHLYWIRMAQDLLGFSSDTNIRGAITTTWEPMGIASVLLKLFAGFKLDSEKLLLLQDIPVKAILKISMLLQFVFLGIIFWSLHRAKKTRTNILNKSDIQLLQFGLASFCIYIVAPEFSNDFSIVLFPLFLSGFYFILNFGALLATWQKILFVVSWFLVYYPIGPQNVAKLLFLHHINHSVGNIPVHSWEALSLYLIPSLGIFLAAFCLLWWLFQSESRYLNN